VGDRWWYQVPSRQNFPHALANLTQTPYSSRLTAG